MYVDKYPSIFFAPNGGDCVYYPSNLFGNTCSFENWGIFQDTPQFQLRNIWSRNVLRPIPYEQKYLMDYKTEYTPAKTREYPSDIPQVSSVAKNI